MAITFVQANVGSSGSATSLAVAYSSALTPGHGLAAFAFCGAHTLTIADDSTQTWVEQVHLTTSGGRHLYGWYVANSTTSTAATVTITPSAGSDELHLHIYEHAGSDTSSPVDGNNSNDAGGSPGTNYDPGLVFVSDNDILYGMAVQATTATPNPETLYTRQTSTTPNFNSSVEYKILTAAISEHPDWPSNPNSTYFAIGVSIKPAAAAADTLMGQAVL